MTRTSPLATAVAFFLVACVSGAERPEGTAQPNGQQQKPLSNMLVINEDNSHFFGTRKPEEMTVAGLHAFVDQYAGSAVTGT